MQPDSPSRGSHHSISPTTRGFDRAAVGLGLLLAAWLSFANLDAQHLWQDEAQTALLSRTTLAHGLPLGSDGRNFFSQELGAEYDDSHRWRWHTWLHFYLVAGSFALLGETTTAARLPGALFGLLTAWTVYALGREWWRDRFAAPAALWVLVVLVPFWILSRQARYYSLTACLSVLLLYGYARIANGRRAGVAVYAGSAIALFHAHYVYVPPLLAATALHAALLRRQALRSVLLGAGAAVVLCAPWIVWQSGMDYGRHYADALLDPSHWWHNATLFVRKGMAHLSGMALLIGGAASIAAIGWRRGAAELARLAADPGLLCLVLSGLAVLGTISLVAPEPFFRYLTPLVPMAALGLGALVAAAARTHAVLGAAVFSLIVAYQPLGRFAYELTHEFEGPIEVLSEYLTANADPGDVVWTTYGDLPLKFYTNHRVLGGLTGEDLEAALEHEPPDWLIRRHHIIHPERDGVVASFIEREIDLRDFRRIELPVVDTAFENREEPGEHLYQSAKSGRPVTIFKRPR